MQNRLNRAATPTCRAKWGGAEKTLEGVKIHERRAGDIQLASCTPELSCTCEKTRQTLLFLLQVASSSGPICDTLDLRPLARPSFLPPAFTQDGDAYRHQEARGRAQL